MQIQQNKASEWSITSDIEYATQASNLYTDTLVGLIGYFQNSASDSDEVISLLDRTQQGF